MQALVTASCLAVVVHGAARVVRVLLATACPVSFHLSRFILCLQRSWPWFVLSTRMDSSSDRRHPGILNASCAFLERCGCVLLGDSGHLSEARVDSGN